MIRVDSTAFSTVVRCDRCAGWYWAGLGGERDRAHRVAAAHEASCHPGDTAAREAAKKYTGRHSENLS